MSNREKADSKPSEQTRLRSFQELMQHRVRRVLLVSSLYDSFILSEEGHLHEALFSRFIDLNISNIPDLVRVPDGTQALRAAESRAPST